MDENILNYYSLLKTAIDISHSTCFTTACFMNYSVGILVCNNCAISTKDTLETVKLLSKAFFFFFHSTLMVVGFCIHTVKQWPSMYA